MTTKRADKFRDGDATAQLTDGPLADSARMIAALTGGATAGTIAGGPAGAIIGGTIGAVVGFWLATHH
ncbi:MAG: hypothetical protein QOD83_584 [Solirubrobacteraceae bacterium]|jgi:hypothetical protein|nr:hypothetical protein [Solirubrobacteraceae bacterium]